MIKYNKDSHMIYIKKEDKYQMDISAVKLVVVGYSWSAACEAVNEILLDNSIINPCLN